MFYRYLCTILITKEKQMFDTKVAILVLDDMEVWKKLNVTAFLATGIAASVSEAIGEPYIDAEGNHYTPLLGQPIMIYAADRSTLIRTRNQALQRGADVWGLCGSHVRNGPRRGEPGSLCGRTCRCAGIGRSCRARADQGSG
jgi:hypothetical protein